MYVHLYYISLDDFKEYFDINNMTYIIELC